MNKHHSMEAALWKVDWILIQISPLVCCLEESLPWLTVWKKDIWDNISVKIHGKLGVWYKESWLFYLENCCLAHCDWKNVVWNKAASIHRAIVWKNMSGTKHSLLKCLNIIAIFHRMAKDNTLSFPQKKLLLLYFFPFFSLKMLKVSSMWPNSIELLFFFTALSRKLKLQKSTSSFS